jgi:uncharacterized alkaline shock family protein YloU
MVITMTIETELGVIRVSPLAVATIASQAVLESYGVVGMASKNLRDGLFELLTPGAGHRGVDVHISDRQVTVDLYVIIEYGLRVSEVAHNIMSVVKFRIEKALGMPVARVNVHVQGLRVSTEDRRQSSGGSSLAHTGASPSGPATTKAGDVRRGRL